MTGSHSKPSSEAQLESLLKALLEEERGSDAALPAHGDVPPDIIALAETARLLRASTQWVPLPEGRAAVRRALLATAQEAQSRRLTPFAPRRRSWGIAVAALAAMFILAFGLGAGVLDGLGLPGSPLYGLRLELDALRVAIVPSPVSKAELLVRSAHLRIAEIDEMVSSGDTRGVAQAAAALDQEAAWLRAITALLSPAERQRLADAIEH